MQAGLYLHSFATLTLSIPAVAASALFSTDAGFSSTAGFSNTAGFCTTPDFACSQRRTHKGQSNALFRALLEGVALRC